MSKLKTIQQAINHYYAEQWRKKEIEAVGPQRIAIHAVFPSFVACNSVLNHWGRAMRKILNQTIVVDGWYLCKGKKKPYKITVKTKKQFLKELRQ